MIANKSVAKDSPIPIYYQIYVDLKKKLLGGWEEIENGKLPPEQELAKAYNVSRVCMRQAMAELEKDNLIVRYRGRGSFLNVSPKPILHNLDLSGLSQQSVRQYIDKYPEIVELRRFNSTYEHISQELKYQGTYFYIKRIMKIDRNPISVNRIWVPEKFAPDLEQTGLCVEGSLSKTLEQVYHLKAHHRSNIIEAVRPSASEVQLLKITYDTLILQVSSTSFLEDDTPFEHSVTSWIGDSIRLKIDVYDIEHRLEFSKR